MAQYIIPFSSRKGQEYEVRVTSPNLLNDVTLTGGSNPITVQEEDDEDLFKPVRLRSGYIRFIDRTGATQRAMMPNSTIECPVELRWEVAGQWQVMFTGFLLPETFTSELWRTPRECELPICCPLTALESLTLPTPSDTSPKNFFWLLSQLLSLTGTQFRYVYIQRRADVADWFFNKFQWAHLLDDDGEMKYNPLELLEHIASFWGYVVRTVWNDLVFVQPDVRDGNGAAFARWTPAQIAQMGDGTAVLSQNAAWGSKNLLDYTCIAGAQETFMPGIRKVTVKADIDAYDDLGDMDFSSIIKKYEETETPQIQLTASGFLVLLYPQTTAPDISSLSQFEQTKDYDLHTSYVDDNNYSYFRIFGSYPDQQPATTHQLNYNFHIQGVGSNADGLIRIVSRKQYILQNCVIAINLQFEGTEDQAISAYLRVGDLYYYYNPHTTPDSYGWSSTKHTFPLQITGNKIADYRELLSPFENYSGFGAIVEYAVAGDVEFGITYAPSRLIISSVSIKIANSRTQSIDAEKDENLYTAEGGAFLDDRDIDLGFATWNGNPTGSAFVLQPSFGYLQEIQYGSTYARPEQVLADRVAEFGQRTRRVMTVDIKTKGSSPTNPRQVVLNEFEDSTYPISISNDWAEDVETLKLIQL